MKKFLHSHPTLIITIVYFTLIGILLVFYFWAVNNVFAELSLALLSPPSQNADGFNLSSAEKLDLHGLVVNPSSAPSSTSSAATPQ